MLRISGNLRISGFCKFPGFFEFTDFADFRIPRQVRVGFTLGRCYEFYD